MSTKISLFPRALALAGAFMIAALPALAETSTATPGAKAGTQVSGETDKKTDTNTDKSKSHAAAHKSKEHAMTKTAAAGNQKQPVAQKPAAKTSEEPAKTSPTK